MKEFINLATASNLIEQMLTQLMVHFWQDKTGYKLQWTYNNNNNDNNNNNNNNTSN